MKTPNIKKATYNAGKKPKKPVVTPTPIPAVIPVQDVVVTDSSKKKAAAAQQKKGGVASTVLSDALGG